MCVCMRALFVRTHVPFVLICVRTCVGALASVHTHAYVY